MGIIVFILIIAAFCLFVICASHSEQESYESGEDEMTSLMCELFHENTSLNSDAFDAYKSMIQESFNMSQATAPQPHQQDKRRW